MARLPEAVKISRETGEDVDEVAVRALFAPPPAGWPEQTDTRMLVYLLGSREAAVEQVLARVVGEGGDRTAAFAAALPRVLASVAEQERGPEVGLPFSAPRLRSGFENAMRKTRRVPEQGRGTRAQTQDEQRAWTRAAVLDMIDEELPDATTLATLIGGGREAVAAAVADETVARGGGAAGFDEATCALLAKVASPPGLRRSPMHVVQTPMPSRASSKSPLRGKGARGESLPPPRRRVA